MAERFENLDDILPDWAKENVEKSLVEAVNSCEAQLNSCKAARRKKYNILEQSQSSETK